MLATSSLAHAVESDQPPVLASVRYTASASGCVGASALEAMVEERLQRKVFVHDGNADLLVEIDEREVPEQGYRVTLTLRSKEGIWLGARELEGPSGECAALDESLALVVAIAVDIPKEELLARERAAAQPTPTAKPAPPPAPRRLRVPEPRYVPRRARASQRVEWTPAAAFAISAGILPGLTPGARLSFGVRPPNFWRSEIGGSWWKSQDASEDDRGSHFKMLALDFSVCPWEGGSRSVRVLACAMQMLGQIRAHGFGFDENREPKRFFYAFGARLQAGFRLSDWARLRLAGSGLVPASRDRFIYVDSLGRSVSVYRAAPVGGVAELGLELTF